MNVQAHMSGQVPNQLSQQNGNTLPVSAQMQNLSGNGAAMMTAGASGRIGVNNMMAIDPEMARARSFMREKILALIMQRQLHPIDETQKQRYRDVSERVESGLYRAAPSKEEYMNLNTLEARMANLLKRGPMSNHSQRQVQMVNSSSVVGPMIPTPGTMIPTPGIAHGGSSNLIPSNVDALMIASSGGDRNSTTGSLLPTSNMHGTYSNGFQPLGANFSVSSGGGNLSPMGVQRTSQMIPTPGFNNNNSNSQTFIHMGSSNNNSGYSNTETPAVTQLHQQKQYAGGQNSRILQNLGNHLGGSMRSSLQQKPYRFSSSSLHSGMGVMPNNLHIMNDGSAVDGYLSGQQYSNSSKSLQSQLDSHQRQLVQNDAYGMGNTDTYASGGFYGSTSSVGSMMNSQTLNSAGMQSTAKVNMVDNQLNMIGMQQVAEIKAQPVDQTDKINFQSSISSRENLLQPHQQSPYQQHANHFQHKQFAQHGLQNQVNQQHQHILSTVSFNQPQVSSNQAIQVKHESGFDHHHESLLPQTSDKFQVNELQAQLQKTSNMDCRSSQQLSLLPGQNDISALAPGSHQQQVQQMLQQQHLVEDPQNAYNCLSVRSLNDIGVEGQWHRQAQDNNFTNGGLQEQQVQNDFHQRLAVQDEAQPNSFTADALIPGQTILPRNAVVPQNSTNSLNAVGNGNRELQFRRQQMWLLFLLHARNCGYPEGKCPSGNPCTMAQKLLGHMNGCNVGGGVGLCPFPRCFQTKKLVNHFKTCQDTSCPVCIPVKKYRGTQSRARTQSSPYTGMAAKFNDIGDARSSENLELPQPLGKRVKIEQSTPVRHESEGALTSSPKFDGVVAYEDSQNRSAGAMMIRQPEVSEVKTEIPVNCRQIIPVSSIVKRDAVDDVSSHDREPTKDDISGVSKQEIVKSEKESESCKQGNALQPSESVVGSKSGKPKIKGVSLTELFTPEQIEAHIAGLRKWVGQSKAKVEKNQAMENCMSENSCQLCAVEKLTFEPPPIYCSLCGNRIKRNALYQTVGAGETKHYVCIPCYNDARGDTITVDGTIVPKSQFEKKKNDEETEEWWVQCDKCEAWQHQICALFNGRRNECGQAEYTCPQCSIKEIKLGQRSPLPQNTVLGAKDLPKTILSDHIEQRLFKRLKQERQERARVQGKSYDEVPGAESLVIRVVSSVDKKLEVKPRFLEIFREENYPTEFPYKSKVVLLFQKIEGVEVCLYGMYVQEFGSECQFPNQRRVYLSYLDSVKYFRPDVKAVTGEALRTFVYHEILIGYLEYCKKRGFTSCYIWACPPLKGEDYILYCHPEIQKTPKSDKLREWYLSMLRKAAKENIVVDLTNLYDHFFVCLGECKAKVTASRLPYFDGDYWPGAAEDLIYQLNQEEDGRKLNKKGTIKKTITKRALKASGQSDLSGNASKDFLLMHKLGETISPMKEDFIMVHLQHCCTHCCTLMVSGNRWVCSQCKNFQLCDKCYEDEQKREERDRHPINQRDKHVLFRVEIADVPVDTKDKDEILESEFFDTRQAFLSLCQGNHYQYDTLRRAKHSSMMVLYHLHNPTAPAFVTTCNVCHLDIEAGQGWRCDVCPEYDVCNSCYQKDGGIDHPHKLTNHPSTAERDAQNKEARQIRVLQLRRMLDLLVHASQCRSPLCQYPNCRKVKGLFRHGQQCRKRASGGCVLCKRMWYLLQLHARACKESSCHVPRCKDLKEHVRRLQQQSDSRRRAAVMEMMRQRAAEVAGNSG